MKPLAPLTALILVIIVAGLSILPLAFVTIPPMVDYPNHLARCAVLAQMPNNPALSAMYEPRSVLLPNMAMDAIVVPLSKVMGVVQAGKLFCASVLLIMLTGALALSWALNRRVTLWSFCPALFLFNHIYAYGFLNYLFGVGLLLWSLAAWIELRDRPLAARLAVGSILAIVLFFAHLVAMFLFACAVAGLEIARWTNGDTNQARGRDLKGLVVLALQVGSMFIVPAALLLRSPTHSEASEYHASSLGEKLDMLIGMLRIDSNRLDAVYSALVFGALIALFLRKAVVIDSRMRYAIAAIAGSFLLLPDSFATCGCVDIRIPVVVAMLIAASSTVVLPKGRMFQFGMAALIGGFFLRSYQVSRDWRMAESTSQQVLADLKVLPPKAVVFYAADREANIFTEKGWAPPLVHLAVAEMLYKPIFFPQLFALPTQHPLAIRPELLKLEEFQSQSPFEFDDSDGLADIVRVCHEEADDPDDVPQSLGRDPSFFLFVITPPGKPDVETYANSEVIVRRPRYALLKITNTEAASRARWEAALEASRSATRSATGSATGAARRSVDRSPLAFR